MTTNRTPAFTTMTSLAAALLLTLAVAGCQRADQAETSAGYAADAAPSAPPAPAPAPEMAADGRARMAIGGGEEGLVGQANPEGSFLAYSHYATVRLGADQISPRVGAVRDACMQKKYGECTVLNESQQAGEYPSGSLQVRAEPKAIQPLVALAADGGELASRNTSAEDLADAVRDNGLRRARLEKQHARLLQFLDRDDLTAESLVTLTGQLAQIEAELQYAEQEAAQQERRIRTNLLNISFEAAGVTVETSAIRQALRGAGNLLDGSVAALITIAVALVPFAIVGAAAFVVIRGWSRRRRAKRAAAGL